MNTTTMLKPISTDRKAAVPFFKNKERKNNSPVFFQPKLTVGPTDDVYEREADAVADSVMRMTGSEGSVRTDISSPGIQRMCSECEEEKAQRKENGGGNAAGHEAPPVVNDAVRREGKPLDNGTRSFMESRMGYDFSNVRIHTDTVAAKSAQAINALAYTSGNNVVFNEGQYAPGTASGKKLLAHELTHVVQQSGQSKNVQRLTVSPVGNISTGRCGQYSKQWIFGLDNPAPEDGYIVQQVDMYEEIVDCPMTARCLANPTFTFYEAWWLEKGDTRQHIHDQVGFTDQAQRGQAPGKSGSHSAVGTIKFFKKSVTGDLGREDVPSSDQNSPWKPGNQGGVRLSGWLPSTTQRPSWWNNSTEGPARRYANSDWTCCGDASRHWSISTATP